MVMQPIGTSDAPNTLDASSFMEDFIIVENLDDMRDDRSTLDAQDSDEDSYDHCEDVFSQDDDESVGSTSSETREELILTVPSGLMKDLDEAHAAAELAHITTNENGEAENESESAMAENGQVSNPATVETTTAVGKDESITAEVSVVSTAKSVASGHMARTKPTPAAVSAPTNLSRASNKKRRKKLKLLKKAQAAANAAQAISARSVSSGTKTKIKGGKKVATPIRGSSRKVANIAVACARETMASYRQEVQFSSMSKQPCT